MLEEVGLPYRVHPIDITKDEQFAPAFLKIAPNNKIPAIVDTDNGLHLMESGAILLYLAEKTGKLWPQNFPAKWRVVEWLMWQMGGPGPFLGQVASFREVQSGQERLCRGALWQGGEAALGGARPAAGRGRVCRGRLFDRRYRHLALDLALRLAEGRLRRPSQCEALVSGDRGAAGGASGAGMCCRKAAAIPHAVMAGEPG